MKKVRSPVFELNLYVTGGGSSLLWLVTTTKHTRKRIMASEIRHRYNGFSFIESILLRKLLFEVESTPSTSNNSIKV
jgi:hypothetical protein